MARVEPVLLAEMLTNLVDNAVTHGGNVVTLRVTEAGDRVVLTVEDNGPGLSAEQEAAFLAGRRDGQLPAVSQGPAAIHGFGLAIVREIGRRIGAEIAVARRADGQGLVVSIGIAA